MSTWNFVTTNDYKFKKFMEVAMDMNLDCEQLCEQTPEIQADSNADVAKFSAKWAAEKFKKNVICEDVGMYLKHYKGFPGVYLSYVEKWLGSEGLLKLMEDVADRAARWEYAVSYCRPGEDPVVVSTNLGGRIAYKAKGSGGWATDSIFLPEGESRTIAELLDVGEFRRSRFHYEDIVKKICEKQS